VLPRSFVAAFCSGILTILGVYLAEESVDRDLRRFDAQLTIFMSFSSVVGFMLVFRISQAMIRFDKGLHSLFAMTAFWTQGCGSLISFANSSKRADAEIRNFHVLVTQLFSMLNAAAMQKIAGPRVAELGILSHGMLDDESLSLLEITGEDSLKPKRIGIIHHWIEELINRNSDTGVLSHTPAPILSRVFQELSQGHQELQSAMAIAYVPFPFPYSQLTSVLLLVYSISMPYFSSGITTNWLIAFCLSFVLVSTMWAISYIAAELEQPFQDNANDLPMKQIHQWMYESLMLRLDTRMHKAPQLTENGTENAISILDPCSSTQMTNVASGACLRLSRTATLSSHDLVVPERAGDVMPTHEISVPPELSLAESVWVDSIHSEAPEGDRLLSPSVRFPDNLQEVELQISSPHEGSKAPPEPQDVTGADNGRQNSWRTASAPKCRATGLVDPHVIAVSKAD